MWLAVLLQIAVDKDQLDHSTHSAPLMPGSEYISTELLKTAWSRLNAAFSQAIKSYKGTVAEFIRTYSPELHLVGRIFFHLVENKVSLKVLKTKAMLLTTFIFKNKEAVEIMSEGIKRTGVRQS